MSTAHLGWIIPVSFMMGFIWAALLTANGRNR